MEIQTMITGLWIDDVRDPQPFTYKNTNVKWTRVRSVKEAKYCIRHMESIGYPYNLISSDHDAGEFVVYGGDYIKLLDWLEETGRSYPIHIHTDNAVARERMRAIIQRNGWKEIR